jgi:DNA-binding transcriptional regulator YhcF (GntR family)
MAPSGSARQATLKGVERVRHELLTALHFGQLTPGDQVPSVRRLADLTGLNRKTVHRAYGRLAREGLLDVRPGSGTFIAETASGASEPAAPISKLLSAANRCRATAESLGIRAEDLATFLQIYLGHGLRDLPLVVAECNREQLGLIDLELRTALGVQTRPVLLSQLAVRPEESLARHWGVVTTDCHRAELARAMEPLGIPVYRVALDPRFPRALLAEAERGPLLMVVRDRQFVPVFLRLLRQLGGTPEVLSRVRIVEPMDAAAALAEMDGPVAAYLSPLVHGIVQLPPRCRRVRLRWRLEPACVDRLRASVALDLAAHRGTAPRHRSVS